VRVLEAEIAAHYLPFAVHVPVDPEATQPALQRVLPFVDGMKAHGGGAVYVCRDFTCRQPVGTPEALRAELA
jgi:uncharacterized protein YyaL (SSP411 family)